MPVTIPLILRPPAAGLVAVAAATPRHWPRHRANQGGRDWHPTIQEFGTRTNVTATVTDPGTVTVTVLATVTVTVTAVDLAAASHWQVCEELAWAVRAACIGRSVPGPGRARVAPAAAAACQ